MNLSSPEKTTTIGGCRVAGGLAWEAIIEEWNGNITKEAIAEAVQLATQALLEHADDFILEPAPA